MIREESHHDFQILIFDQHFFTLLEEKTAIVELDKSHPQALVICDESSFHQAWVNSQQQYSVVPLPLVTVYNRASVAPCISRIVILQVKFCQKFGNPCISRNKKIGKTNFKIALRIRKSSLTILTVIETKQNIHFISSSPGIQSSIPWRRGL